MSHNKTLQQTRQPVTPPLVLNGPYMDSSSACKHSVGWREVRLLTYIRPLTSTSIGRCAAIMGYSRAGSPSLLRAWCTWTFSGSASAGSTCSPSNGLLCNRE